MQISKRMTGITGTGTDGWEIFTKARDMIEAGTDVIELTVGQHDISTDPAILDAMHASAKAGNTGYSELPGSNAQKAAVADFNKDGYKDIVFAFSGGFWEYRDKNKEGFSPSRIYWGSPTGFSKDSFLNICSKITCN